MTTQNKNLYVILAVSKEKQGYGIAKEGKIPWRFPLDMNVFSAMTKMAPFGTRNSIIMGAITWNTIAPGLPDRLNIVVSSGRTPLIDGNYILVSTFEEAIIISKDCHRIYAIGGIDIVLAARKHEKYQKEYLTLIKNEYQTDRNIDYVPLNKPSFTYNYDGTEIVFYNYNDYSTDGEDDEFDFRRYKSLPSSEEYQYLAMLHFLMFKPLRETRNAPTRSSFGTMLKFKLRDKDGNNVLPALTTKKMNIANIWAELQMFLRGETNTSGLLEKGIKIWEGNTNKDFLEKMGLDYPEGFMGPMYGYQWRFFNKPYHPNEDLPDKFMGVDQLSNLLDDIKKSPHSRRLCITTFNPEQANDGVLYPCHGLVVQFYVSDIGQLDCMMYQRSADIFLGLPYNIVSYGLLTHLIVHCLNQRGMNLVPGRLLITLGDWHLYYNHFEPALKQIVREPLTFPQIEISSEKSNPWDYVWEDFNIKNYSHGPFIKGEMSA